MGESVSRKLGEEESSYAWIRLHPGCTARRSESDWRFMGVYCSHPACQSKPLECFGMFFLALQPVFIVLRGPLFCNLS